MSTTATIDAAPRTSRPKTGRLPDFLCVGAPRSGSTWLYEALRAHPQVFVPEAKGFDFFDRHFERGVDWYAAHFAEAGAGLAVGELSHDVYAHPLAPSRIAAVMPRARLLLCLREPGDFARSIVQWLRTHTDLYGRSVGDIVASAHVRALLDYAGAVERLHAAVGPDRLKVVFYEDLRRDPGAFIADVYDCLGIDPAFRPPMIETRVNRARSARYPALNRALFRTARLLRDLGAGDMIERLKTRRAIQTILYRERASAADGLSHEACEALRRRMRPQLSRLETLLDRPLPPEWDMG